MFTNIDFSRLLTLLAFDPDDPLVFTTSFFLIFFFLVIVFYQASSSRRNIRVLGLIAFSLFFYYKSSGYYFLLLLFSAGFSFLSGKLIYSEKSIFKRRLLLFLSIIVNVGLLGYFKYTNFFIQIINDFNKSAIDPLDIFLPIGISFYTFKALSYIFDIYLEKMEPEAEFKNFCLYIVFFPNLLAGPIDRAENFIEQIKGKVFVSDSYLGRGLYLILGGLFKKAVIADYISLNFVDRVFDMPSRYTGVENLLAVYGYALQIYCDFSGYTDIAIGIALLMGIKLMDNFNSPYQAASVSEFWRRWHISLSSWLLDYLFKPLQLKFRGLSTLGNALALILTFLICGLWHGASWTFIFWGGLHGLLMAVALFTKKPKMKLYKKLHIADSRLLKYVQVFITFNLVAFAWVFFRANSFNDAIDVLTQVFSFFHSEVFMQFASSYPQVLGLILLGYILHFLPKQAEIWTQNLLARTPVLGKAFLLAVMIWVVAQVRASDLQPFIYFQF